MWNLFRVVINLIPALVRLVPLVAHLMGDRRVPGVLKLLLPAALIYLISPLDLLPELFFGGAGWIDDIIAIITAVALFLWLSPKPVVASYRRQWQGATRTRDKTPNGSKTTIEGYYEVLQDEEDGADR